MSKKIQFKEEKEKVIGRHLKGDMEIEKHLKSWGQGN